MATKRTYNTRRIKATLAYTVQEIAELFGLHKNAVLHWLKGGLKANPDGRPYLIRGDEIIRFLNDRQQSKKQRCALDQFFCFKCRALRTAYEGIADLTIETPTRFRIKGLCVVCGTPVNKVQGVKNLAEIESCFHIQQREDLRIREGVNSSVNSDKRQYP